MDLSELSDRPSEAFPGGLDSPKNSDSSSISETTATTMSDKVPAPMAPTKKNSISADDLKTKALSLEEFNELYNIEFKLEPKDFSISTTFDDSQEPFFNVNLITRIKFNTIAFWNENKRTDDARGRWLSRNHSDSSCHDLRSNHFQSTIMTRSFLQKEDESVRILREMSRTLSGVEQVFSGEKEKPFAGDTSIEEFSKHHLLPVPTIRCINHSGYPDPIPTTCHLRKQKIEEDQKKRLHELMEKATGGNGKQYIYNLKIVTYEAIQIYHNFRISFDGYTQNTKRFPLDVHQVQFSISFNPVFTYSDRNKEYFELKVGQNKGRLLYRKDNYYPKVTTLIPFPPHSHLFADERILKLDMIPESLRINKYDYGLTKLGEKKLKEDALLMSFSLHRVIAAPFINLFLPIYVICFLVPFSCLFFVEDCEEHYFGNKPGICKDQRFADNDLTATYLSALLLTLVAHRSVIASSQSATVVYTLCDIDFTICLISIVAQMIILNLFINKKSDDFGRGSMDDIFWVEECLWLVWVTYRCYGFFSSGLRNMVKRPILFMEYMELQRDMQLFRLKNTRLKRKTFFSTNIKLITSYNSSKQRRKTIAATTPIEDLYRLRLYNNEKGKNILFGIKMNHYITEEYTEKVCQDRVRTVYCLTTPNKKLLLEVECLFGQRERKTKKVKLKEYEEKKKEELSNVEELGNLTKARARQLFLQSVIIEFICMFIGQGFPLGLYNWKLALKSCFSFFNFFKRVQENWRHIREDRKLLRIILELLSKEGDTQLHKDKAKEVNDFFLEHSHRG